MRDGLLYKISLTKQLHITTICYTINIIWYKGVMRGVAEVCLFCLFLLDGINRVVERGV